MFLYNQSIVLPPYFVRVDVAHVIHFFCRIKFLIGKNKKTFKIILYKVLEVSYGF